MLFNVAMNDIQKKKNTKAKPKQVQSDMSHRQDKRK